MTSTCKIALAIFILTLVHLSFSFHPCLNPRKSVSYSKIVVKKATACKSNDHKGAFPALAIHSTQDNHEQASLFYDEDSDNEIKTKSTQKNSFLEDARGSLLPLTMMIFGAVFMFSRGSYAGSGALASLSQQQLFDPANFQPVCPASDGLYQIMKGIANNLIGTENAVQYGPLIAGVLLRVRLELCVFESFLYEAVIPFIKQNGISWILPLKETAETVAAGTIFAVASNFILLGSTKIFAVLMIYFDALIGFPTRLIGKALKKLDGTGASKVADTIGIIGAAVGKTRQVVETIDTFIGRYLVFGTTLYVIFKICHYKFFNFLF